MIYKNVRLCVVFDNNVTFVCPTRKISEVKSQRDENEAVIREILLQIFYDYS